MNTVTRKSDPRNMVPVSSLAGGTLVQWEGVMFSGVFVVVRNRPNADDIAAISLSDGGYLHGHILVTPLETGEELEIIAG